MFSVLVGPLRLIRHEMMTHLPNQVARVWLDSKSEHFNTVTPFLLGKQQVVAQLQIRHIIL